MREANSGAKKGVAFIMTKVQNYQDVFLNTVRKDKSTVVVFLMNGFQMKGIVRGFDNFVVLLDSDGKQQMIYKHAISTIVPPYPIDLSAAEDSSAQ